MAYKTASWTRSEGKDKNGGLNAKGVASYRKANPGSKLKTGVDKVAKTPEEKRRQGSFFTRFYTNPKGPLKKPNGEPTRLALAARKWNKPAPSSVAQAKKLASFGRNLLASYKRGKDAKSK